jgi:phosphatidylethanolamine-binding protein (PEBP) family uncharacterized protein
MTCKATGLQYSIHRDRSIVIQELLHDSIYADLQKYNGPCPTRGTHHYYFKLYSLNCVLDIPEGSNKLQLEKAMSDHIIAFGEIIWLFTRQGN